ncbi:MAG: lysophospholipid acyltransferase family protein [Polyangiaceae bacterium]
MTESTPHTAGPKGRFLQWFLGNRGAHWGTDPGEYTPALVEETVSSIGRLFGPGCYFGLEIEGWENVPPAPAMLVSNHSGGTTIPDVWGLLIGWYRRFGAGRPCHPLAHEIILATELTARFFSKRGVLKANPRVAEAVLTRFKRDLLVMPGGDIDTWRPYSDRYKARFGGRRGYAKLALRTGVPVVPVANAGAHETLLVLTDGRKFAKAIGLPDVARAEIFPVHLSLPWGLGIGPLPHLPTPATLRYKIGKPVEVPKGAVPGEEPSDEHVAEYAERVEAAVQSLLDKLREEEEERLAATAGRAAAAPVITERDLRQSLSRATERLSTWGQMASSIDLSQVAQAVEGLRTSLLEQLYPSMR